MRKNKLMFLFEADDGAGNGGPSDADFVDMLTPPAEPVEIEDKPKEPVKIEDKPKVEDKPKEPVKIEDKPKVEDKPKEPVKEKTAEELKLELAEEKRKNESYEKLLKDKLEGKETAIIDDKPKEPVKSVEEQLGAMVLDDDLKAFVSGDMDLMRKSVVGLMKTIVNLTMDTMNAAEQHKTVLTQYKEETSKAFYDKYPKLQKYRDIVRVVGNDVNRRNPNKQPHELIDEIGQGCMKILEQAGMDFAPTVEPKVKKVGEVPGAAIVPEAEPKLTEQQKEMIDLEQVS